MAASLNGLEFHPFRIPMRWRFRRVTFREGVLIRGPAGWGEFSPFADYSPRVAARWLQGALEAATSPFPSPRRTRIPINVTVPAIDPDTAHRLVRESGCSTAKVKVAEPGEDSGRELERLEAVRHALGTDGRLRVDANAGWDVPTAVARIEAMAHLDIEYVEQPVATVDEMADIRRKVTVRIAADESIRQADDALEVVRQEAADVAVLKVQSLGGIDPTLKLAHDLGIPVVISSALESSIGIAAGLAAAAALPHLDHACGLGTVAMLEGDLAASPSIPVGGYLTAGRVEPHPELLERYRPDPDVAQNLIDRLRAASELLP